MPCPSVRHAPSRSASRQQELAARSLRVHHHRPQPLSQQHLLQQPSAGAAAAAAAGAHLETWPLRPQAGWVAAGRRRSASASQRTTYSSRAGLAWPPRARGPPPVWVAPRAGARQALHPPVVPRVALRP
jgi:hypothetical protein